eukprot:scaffold31313_cov101-Isochrysis_galbana.AAC.1
MTVTAGLGGRASDINSRLGWPRRSHRAARSEGQRRARWRCKEDTDEERAAKDDAMVLSSTCEGTGDGCHTEGRGEEK